MGTAAPPERTIGHIGLRESGGRTFDQSSSALYPPHGLRVFIAATTRDENPTGTRTA